MIFIVLVSLFRRGSTDRTFQVLSDRRLILGSLIQETFYRQGPFFMGYDEPMKASEKVTALLNDRLELFTDDFMQTGMTYKAKEVLRPVFLCTREHCRLMLFEQALK